MESLSLTDPAEITSTMQLARKLRFDSKGFVDATELANVFGSRPHNYESNQKNQTFLVCLAKQLGLTRDDLIRPGAGGPSPENRMYHPRVALDFARWKDPQVAVELSGILSQYLEERMGTSYDMVG